MSALHCRPSPYSVFFDMKQRADPHFVMMSRFLAVLHGTGQLTSSGKVFVCGYSFLVAEPGYLSVFISEVLTMILSIF